MSYLDRLKARSSGGSVGSVGEGAAPECRPGHQSRASVGSVGAEGGHVSQNEVRGAPSTPRTYLEELQSRLKSEVFRQNKPPSDQTANSETRPLRDPTKPTKALKAADLRNSLALYIPQLDSNRCHVCGGREGPDFPFIPVLSAKPECPHWIHEACHAEYVRLIDARVEAVLADADPRGPPNESF